MKEPPDSSDFKVDREREDRAPSVPNFFDVGPEVARAFDAVHHELKKERLREAFRALVELRQRLGGFGRRLVAMVYVPQCEDCYALERHQMQADDSTWRPPDISIESWRRDLREFASASDIRRTYRKMADTSREHPVVRCDTCKQEIIYGREAVYVFGRPFEHHFPELLGAEGRDPPADPPAYVRKLVYYAYGGRCAGCGSSLTWNQKTMDHIRPRHAGGPGTLENIQLACEGCNARKGDQAPVEVHVWLDFLLVTQGADFDSLARLAGL